MALAAGADVLLIGADAGRPAQQRQEAMDAVLAAVHSGRVPSTRLNAAVSRVLRLKERYGLLDAAAQARPATDAAARVGRDEDALLARRIATRSLTAFGPSRPTLPLAAAASTLVIRPRLGREVIDAEAEAAVARWSGPQTLFLPPNPDTQAINDVLEKARQSKAVVLLVTDARRQSGQVRLAVALAALTDPPVVLVAAQSPYDLALVPQTTLCLATYGEAPASLEALGESLFTPFRFTGRMPAILASHP